MKAADTIFDIVFIIILTLVSVCSCAHGQTTARVFVSPSSVRVQPSLATAIDVKVEGVEKLFAASVTIAFDNTILAYSSVTGGSFLTSNNANSVFLGVVPQPPPPAAPHTITVDQAIPGSRTVSGSGILFTMLFTGLRSGASPITIVSNDFRNSSNTTIPTETVSGNVTINSAPKAVRLLSPPNGSTIDTSLRVLLAWSKSIDSDTEDIVRYDVHCRSAYSALHFCNLSDTSLVLTREDLEENTECTWYVNATDGVDTTSSEETFTFKTPMIRSPGGIPDIFKVEQNYPNPFNQSTVIRFSVPLASHAAVTVFDMTGREIVRLMNRYVEAGSYRLTWDGKNSSGDEMGSGIYFYVATAGRYREGKKMVLLK